MDASPRRMVGVTAQLLLCSGARPSWPQVFCHRDGRAPGQIGARPSWPQCPQGGWSVCQGLFFDWDGVARRSRARKSAEHRIQAERPGPHKQPRRAVDCAPYRLSAPLGGLARGHLGRSAHKVSGAVRGLFRPGWSPAVAGLVRARSTGFKPKDRVHTSNTGAQWTARPTLLSTPPV